MEAEKKLKAYESLIEGNSKQIESELNKKIDMITDCIAGLRTAVSDTHAPSVVQLSTKPLAATKEFLKPFEAQKTKTEPDANYKNLPFTNCIGFESLIHEINVDTNNNTSCLVEGSSTGNSLANRFVKLF